MTAHDPFGKQRFCRGCGCGDRDPCVDPPRAEYDPGAPCRWVLFDIEGPTGICSFCAIDLDWDQGALATILQFERPRPPHVLGFRQHSQTLVLP